MYPKHEHKTNAAMRKSGDTSASDREATKRLAQQGQWRTPPLPAFARGIAAPPAGATGNNLPTTPDEYARMLQEAYTRGAEAGARAQQPKVAQQPPTQQPVVASQPQQPVLYPALSNNMVPAQGQMGASGGPGSIPVAIPSSNIGIKPPPPVSFTSSKSMPDMSSFQATHGDDEEDKRKKRLARNRASARLRRLKKKNLVDSYEGEVGILESALSKMRSHQWGTSTVANHEAPVEALSMERGQQPLTPQKRRELIQSILFQQREQVSNLLECQLENLMLSSLADVDGTATGSVGGGEADEFATMMNDLQSTLQLSPEQMSNIRHSSQGCVHEVEDLMTVDKCLESMGSNQWLLDEGVDEVAGQFTNLLNPSQLSKFLLWADHNADPIDKLEYVGVMPGVVANGPIFEFGVDEGLGDD